MDIDFRWTSSWRRIPQSRRFSTSERQIHWTFSQHVLEDEPLHWWLWQAHYFEQGSPSQQRLWRMHLRRTFTSPLKQDSTLWNWIELPWIEFDLIRFRTDFKLFRLWAKISFNIDYPKDHRSSGPSSRYEFKEGVKLDSFHFTFIQFFPSCDRPVL